MRVYHTYIHTYCTKLGIYFLPFSKDGERKLEYDGGDKVREESLKLGI